MKDWTLCESALMAYLKTTKGSNMADPIKNGSESQPVKDSMDKLDAIAQEVVSINPKQELKRRIINAAKRDISDYYDRFPERALDDRGRDNQDLNIHFIQDILRILDDYRVERIQRE